MPSEVQYFHARRDWWVTLGAGVLILLFLLMVPTVLWSGTVPIWQRALMSGVALILVVSVVDKVFFTVYELNKDGLVLHTQLRRIAIPYREMIEIVPTGFTALFSSKQRKRFALSLHNLTIRIKDPLWTEVSLSPDGESVFLDKLLDKIDSERSRRATVSRKK